MIALVVMVCSALVAGGVAPEGEGAGLQRFLVVPTYTETNPGQSVTLRCEVANKGGECRWEKDGSPVGIFRDKYEWAGDTAAGDCSLVIRDVEAEYDDGVWQCQVTASNFRRADSLISDGAEVVVRSPPRALHLLTKQGAVEAGAAVRATAGSSLDIKCVASGGNPAPVLRFSVAGAELTSETEQINTRLPGGGWRSSLQLTGYIPGRAEDGAEVRCAAQHEAVPASAPLEVRARLDILHAPRVAAVLTNTSRLERGDTLGLSCQVEANPPAQVSWRRGEAGPVVGRGEQLAVSAAELSITEDNIFICEAENEVGISEAAARAVTVSHAPVITSVGPEPSLMLLRGHALVLSCGAAASPAPTYTWLQRTAAGEEVVRQQAESGQLRLASAGYGEAGQWVCRASNSLGEVTSEPVSVEVRGPPSLQPATRDTRLLEVAEGDTVAIEVQFCSNPAPALVWTRGLDIVQQTPRLRYTVASLAGHCARAALTIAAASAEEAGTYVLTVENEHGAARQQLEVAVTEAVLSRELIIGIVAGSLLTLAILVFVTVSRCCRAEAAAASAGAKDLESCGTSTTSDNNKNEKLESDEEIVFNESYEQFAPDLVPAPSEPRRPQQQQPPAYNDLCNFPRAAGGGSMRVTAAAVDRMIHSYNNNILDHINTVNFSNYHNQDNIYYWRQNFDDKIYS